MSHLTYPEAIVVGFVQGISELFPVSSLGHSILLPAWIGGRWATDLSMSGKDSPYLAILVAMHVATALALALYFWRDWARLLAALLSSIRHRRIETPEQRLIWLMIVGSIPVGAVGLGADALRTYLGAPVLAALFLTLNGGLLYSAELMRRRARRTTDRQPPADLETGNTATQPAAGATSAAPTAVLPAVENQRTDGERVSDRRLAGLSVREAMIIGAGQIFGLLPGFSRSGGTIAVGLFRGLRQDDAARFAFLLATPAILGAGILKLPTLLAPANHAVIGPALAGSLVAGVMAYLSIRFLMSYFKTRTVTPYAIYCVIGGIASLVYFLAR